MVQETGDFLVYFSGVLKLSRTVRVESVFAWTVGWGYSGISKSTDLDMADEGAFVGNAWLFSVSGD